MKINGVGRMADNEKALLVMCSAKPTDDHIRALHEWARTIGDSERLESAIDRLDNCVAMLVNGKALPDSIHVEALRGNLPEIAKELRAALRWAPS
jgi:hypothetical protein